MKTFFIIAAVVLLTSPVDAGKRLKQPTQEPVVRGCVVVDNIISQSLGWTTAAGIKAEANNNCDVPASLLVTVAFFDSQGLQIGSGTADQDIAPHTTWPFFVGVPDRLVHGFASDVKASRIIEASVWLRK